MPDALKEYKAKRNFSITSEPADGGEASKEALTFVIQKHWATRLHYDFRLELDGTMKSWAVPKGPSFDSHDKRMAVHVEDHPISYSDFEGTIPPHQYGAGEVIIWDKGTWEPIGDPRKGYAKGEIKFEIHGHKMHGRWVLVRMKSRGERQESWLLIKENDEYMRPASEFSVVDEMPDSVKDLPMPGASYDREAARAKVAGLKADAPASRKKAAEPKAKPAAKSTATKTATRRGAMPAGAVKAELPETMGAELATLVDGPPERPEEWIYEIKFDGYRMLTRVDQKGKDIRLITRNGNDWTDKLRPLQEEIKRMKLPDGWYDGEIVVHDENGKPNFNLLQLAFDGSNRAQIVYFVFDAPYMKGYDLREVRLDERRPLLQAVLAAKPSDTVRFSAEFGTDPSQLVVAACQIGLEGVIGKRRDSRYVNRRSPEWIKLKCGMRQEFVIGGYTDPQGARTGIGSLLLGYYDDKGVLRYAGNCGSGFNGASLRHMRETLAAIQTDENPFPPRAVPGRGKHWVKPDLVAEVSFSEWTATNSIRHPVFQGLRKDKPAKSVVREQARHVQEEPAPEAQPAARKRAADKTAPAAAKAAKPAKPAKAGQAASGLPATFKVTHGERVMDKESGVTKLELVEYYALVGELMMPHLKGRPVSLVRAPEGVGGELFFQKHVADPRKMPGVGQLAQALDPDHPRMTRIDSVEGILSCAQWNVVEIHSQNAVEKRYDTPDRFVFDLDPGEGIAFAQVQEAARLMRAFLQELGLNAFLKTSGGKGLHVVVPIKPRLEWDTVKDFSHAIVTHLAKTLPDRFSDKSGARNRVGRIFIDYLRNGRGATTVAAWSARTRPGLGISVPVRWEELMDLSSGAHWTVRTVGERLAIGNTPWDDYEDSATTLTKAMKALGITGKT